MKRSAANLSVAMGVIKSAPLAETQMNTDKDRHSHLHRKCTGNSGTTQEVLRCSWTSCKCIYTVGSDGCHSREKTIIFFSTFSLLQEAESKAELSQNISAREHFVFTDNDGQVYHLTVEGNSVKDSARIPPDVSVILQAISIKSVTRGLIYPYPVKT